MITYETMMYMGIPIRIVKADGLVYRLESNYKLSDDTVAKIYDYLYCEGFGDSYVDKDGI